MSNIGEYQALLAAATVDYTSQFDGALTIAAYDAADLKNGIQAGALPARLLLPFAGIQNIGAVLGEPGIGNVNMITWTFVDRCLIRPWDMGLGLADIAYDIREYMAAYGTMALATGFGTISDRMNWTSVVLQASDSLEFGGAFYLGVDALWTVDEDDPA
jgi:hypothetical protein